MSSFAIPNEGEGSSKQGQEQVPATTCVVPKCEFEYSISLPATAGTLRESSSEVVRLLTGSGFARTFLPYFYRPSLSASSASKMDGCQVAHAFNSCVAYRGSKPGSGDPLQEPLQVTKDAHLAKKFMGVYGWMGNLIHDLFERLLYTMSDQENCRPVLKTVEELYDTLLRDFDSGWTISRGHSLDSFRRALGEVKSGEPRPLWFTQHALEGMKGRAIDIDADNVSKAKMLAWLESSAAVVRDCLREFIEGSPVSNWKVLEGKYLTNGNVETAEGVSQEEARAASALPHFWISVDGTPLQVFCTMDFGYVRERDGRQELVVTDLKTGKKKPEAHRKQLEMYGIFAIEEKLGFAPEQIVLRLLYPQNPALERIEEYRFDQNRLFAAREQLLKDARRILNCYLPIDHPEVADWNLNHTFPHYDVQFLSALGQYKREGSLPEGIDARRLIQFLVERLSPFEWGLGLRAHCEGVVSALEGAIDRIASTGLAMTQENVNSELLRNLFPKLNAKEILDALSTEHMLVPLATRFGLSARVELEKATPVEAEHPGLTEFLACLSCEFSWVCEEGSAAIKKGEDRRNWSFLR
jgi:hypothetical protein